MTQIDAEVLKAQWEFWGSVIGAAGAVLGALIVGIFGALIQTRHARDKDKQEKEAQWRDHAIELTKLNHARKLKRVETDKTLKLRPEILDFLANYRDLTELDKVLPKPLYTQIMTQRVKQVGEEAATEEESASSVPVGPG